jgi:hypothetical protein
LIFRAWLIEDAPVWFRQIYLRYGEEVGAWVGGHPMARSVVRSFMMIAIRKKLGR